MSRSGNKDLPNGMWQDEETYRRQLNMNQQQQHQLHQQQQQHQHNMQFNVPSVGNDLSSHHPDATNNSLYMANHPQAATSAEHLYSMLPMGNGNYLKVYHNQDENIKFQNYELFASNSFIPIPQMGGQVAASMQSSSNHHQQQQQQPSKPMFQQHQPMFYDHGASHSNVSAPPATISHSAGTGQEDTTNSVFINQLVENWVPNVSGTYSPFGEPATTHHHAPIQREPCTAPEQFSFVQQPSVLCAPVAQHPCPLDSSTSASIHRMPLQPLATNPLSEGIASSVESSLPTASGTNGSFQLQNEEFLIKKSAVTPKKPRMVAEVKPMRKTYADVVSKNVLNKKDTVDTAGSGAVGIQSGGNSVPNAESPSGGGGKANASKSTKENKTKQHGSQSQGE